MKMTMRRTKTLDWKPIPGREKSPDCYAERAGSRWTVKRSGLARIRCAVLRLNGAEIRRFETVNEAKREAERLALEREIVT
jgi:hypothetical protein